MHRGGMHQRDETGPAAAIWLLSGTGEGPRLAESLLKRGWRVLVSVVSAEATRAYAPHPRLELAVGPLADGAAVAAVLERLRPRWVIDATHPFALRISEQLREVCTARHQPTLALARPWVESDLGGSGRLTMLPDLAALGALDLSGERMLLAIGSRHLPAALGASNASAHFARVLDRPAGLQLALAAGLPDSHLACLRPDPHGPGTLERALCRRWRITAVLCRQSGGAGEAFWHRLCAELELRLVLLERPTAAAGPEALPALALLKKLGQP